MYYPSSENKGADQLRSYCEADLRLCFRLGRLLVFPCGGSSLCMEQVLKATFLQTKMKIAITFKRTYSAQEIHRCDVIFHHVSAVWVFGGIEIFYV